MNRLLDERRYTRWTWTVAIVLALLLLLLWRLGRGPGGAAACCAIPAIHAQGAVLPSASAPSRASPPASVATMQANVARI
jgi:hypothetical protein